MGLVSALGVGSDLGLTNHYAVISSGGGARATGAHTSLEFWGLLNQWCVYLELLGRHLCPHVEPICGGPGDNEHGHHTRVSVRTCVSGWSGAGKPYTL